MNFILFCDKKQKRDLEAVINKTENMRLLGTEVVLRQDFLDVVFSEYNPHGVVITNQVRMECELLPAEIAAAIKRQRPAMRIIFYYGEVDEDFQSIYDILTKSCIFDIITKQKFAEIFSVLIKQPFDKAALDDTLKEEEEQEESTSVQDFSRLYDVTEQREKVMINLNREAIALNEFDMFSVKNEVEIDVDYSATEKLNIGIAQLQYKCGCTNAAFEIASYLRRTSSARVCVVMYDDAAFMRLAAYYGVTDGGGLLLNNISIFPFCGNETAQKDYQYIINDIGKISGGDERQEYFDKCEIKLLICSPADWDLALITDFINQDNTPAHINYCFYPISSQRFVSINKRMIKARQKAYRLETSPELYKPCDFNDAVYADIFRQFSTKKKRSKKWL